MSDTLLKFISLFSSGSISLGFPREGVRKFAWTPEMLSGSLRGAAARALQPRPLGRNYSDASLAPITKVEKIILENIKVYPDFMLSPCRDLPKVERPQAQSHSRRTCDFACRIRQKDTI